MSMHIIALKLDHTHTDKPMHINIAVRPIPV